MVREHVVEFEQQGTEKVAARLQESQQQNEGEAGCYQTWGEDTPMLTCSGCRVTRFCNGDHQQMALKKAALAGSLTMGRQKDICRVLSKWPKVVKDSVAPDSCNLDLMAFLQ